MTYIRLAFLGLLLTGCASLPMVESSLPIDHDLRGEVLAGPYRLDPTTTRINFTAGPTPAGFVKGQFAEFAGELSITDAVDGDASLEARLDVTSAEMQSDYFKSILLGPGWFETDVWSEASFTGTLSGWNADGTGNFTGVMTIRDQSHEENFQLVLTCEGVMACPDQNVGFTGQALLDRTKYGMTQMQGFVGRDVKITVSGELLMDQTDELE